MLQNDFFTFATPHAEAGLIKTTLNFNASHKIFEGHFPGQPIVPGVCMMQMVKEVMEQVVGKQTTLLKADNIKFLTVIDPRQNPTVQLSLKLANPSDGLITVDAQLLNGSTTFFKFKGTFSEGQ